jgi:hypothetical protein
MYDFFLTELIRKVKNGKYTKGAILFPQYIKMKDEGRQPSIYDQEGVISKILLDVGRFFNSYRAFEKAYESVYGKHEHQPTELKKVISTNHNEDYQNYLELKRKFDSLKSNKDKREFFAGLLDVEYQEFLLFAYDTLYENQTTDEQENEVTKYKNDVGFNKADAGELSAMIKSFRKKRDINPNEALDLLEAEIIKESVEKYWKQILKIDGIIEIYASMVFPMWKEGIDVEEETPVLRHTGDGVLTWKTPKKSYATV